MSKSPHEINRPGLGASEAVSVFGALAHPTRLEIFRLLVRYLPYGLAAGDIGRLLAVPHNTLSAQLAALEHVGLLQSRRDGRSIIFAAVPARALTIAAFLSEGCKPAGRARPIVASSSPSFPVKRPRRPAKETYNVLVVCTGNSARSIFAEAILKNEGAGRFRPFSAGSRPKARPNPLTLSLLSDLGYDISQYRTKSWNDFATPEAPAMDFIFTVCDLAAREPSPAWPGRPMIAHWGIPDPGAITGPDTEKRAAFLDAYRRLTERVTSFINLDFDTTDRDMLQRQVVAIGGIEGATDMARQLALS
jgi:protein-tyrosine-phosphatase/DNA-binding transcriptional ArsR family regulator